MILVARNALVTGHKISLSVAFLSILYQILVSCQISQIISYFYCVYTVLNLISHKIERNKL